jgi:hypothetical protein
MIPSVTSCSQKVNQPAKARSAHTPLKSNRSLTEYAVKSPPKKLILSSTVDNLIQKALHLVMTSSG